MVSLYSRPEIWTFFNKHKVVGTHSCHKFFIWLYSVNILDGHSEYVPKKLDSQWKSIKQFLLASWSHAYIYYIFKEMTYLDIFQRVSITPLSHFLFLSHLKSYFLTFFSITKQSSRFGNSFCHLSVLDFAADANSGRKHSSIF